MDIIEKLVQQTRPDQGYRAQRRREVLPLTPMLKQYREIKERYPDALVLYRLGDFYELFEEDAKVVSRQLGLTLTTRRFSKDVRLPMCGIPHHRLTGYLSRLIRLGHKVAVVEQLEDAGKTKRLVKRDVVRVITPGTVVEDALLREREDNLLVGIAFARGVGYGLAGVDLSTGRFTTAQIAGADAEATLWEELDRLRPSEVVLPRSLHDDPAFLTRLQALHPARLSPLEDAEFIPAIAATRLKEHLGVASLECFGCDDLPLAQAAAGGVLYYLQSNQISELAHIVRLTTYDPANYVLLDTITCRNLELVATLRDGRREGSLYAHLDRTLTAMGRRMLRRWITRPLRDLEAIRARQEAVGELVAQAELRDDLRHALDGLYDMERLVGRVGFGNANARDLVALRQSLERVPHIHSLLINSHPALLRRLGDSLDAKTAERVAELIAHALVDDPPVLLKDGGLIRPGYDAELERLRAVAGSGRDWLANFEAQERARTGIKNLRVRYNQVFGFFIEVTKSNLHLVPPEYERRATVRHAERFVTPELKAHEAEIIAAEERSKELEYELFVQLRSRIADESAILTRTARAVAELDTLAALAQVAAEESYTCPTLDMGNEIVIRQGRHPVVERSLPDGERFVPNDTLMNQDERMLIITGPNMSGKSVYIRQVASIVLLAQIGSFVPAAEARLGVIDRIFVRAGASDDIARGRSTFLVEMSETGYILRHATPRSLVVLDEVGRGTSTYDGMSIAWAVAEELHNAIGARTLFATHFHELTRLAEHLPSVRNYTLAVAERGHEVVFLRQLVPGGADKSYGIQVARLAGLPERVVERARQVLAELEANGAAANAVPRPDVTPRLDAELQALLQDVYHLDIANLTPVQALVFLNELQTRVKQLWTPPGGR